jgi:hypothetical protein
VAVAIAEIAELIDTQEVVRHTGRMRAALAALVTAIWLGLITPAVVILYVSWRNGGPTWADLLPYLALSSTLWIALAMASAALWRSVFRPSD